MPGCFLVKSRHHTVFHFRRRVPLDLQKLVGKSHLTQSLRTDSRRLAVIRARAAAAQTDALFAHLRAMPKKQLTDSPGFEFTLTFDFDELGRKRAVASDVEPGQEVSAAVAVATLQAHLESGVTHVQAPAIVRDEMPVLTDKLDDVWNDFKAEKINAKAWKDGEDSAKYDYWPHVRAMIEHVGNKSIKAVTFADAKSFQKYVLTAENGGSPQNRKQRLDRVGYLFRWAKTMRFIDDDFHDAFKYPAKIPKNSYLKFENSDLVALFESEAYRTQQFKTPSEYWLPLLALFTGARLNELCQLTASDIGLHDGVDTISILNEDGKRLKNESSRRIVPIHAKLIEIGFLEYASKISSSRIFPELSESKSKQGDYGKEGTRKFTAYRRLVGVGADTYNVKTKKWSGANRKAFHSFRPTLIDALRKANVPKERRTRLAGHQYTDEQDLTYTGGDVLTMFDFATLKADINLVAYDVRFSPYKPR